MFSPTCGVEALAYIDGAHLGHIGVTTDTVRSPAFLWRERAIGRHRDLHRGQPRQRRGTTATIAHVPDGRACFAPGNKR